MCERIKCVVEVGVDRRVTLCTKDDTREDIRLLDYIMKTNASPYSHTVKSRFELRFVCIAHQFALIVALVYITNLVIGTYPTP
jgi:hypothetical protein